MSLARRELAGSAVGIRIKANSDRGIRTLRDYGIIRIPVGGTGRGGRRAPRFKTCDHGAGKATGKDALPRRFKRVLNVNIAA